MTTGRNDPCPCGSGKKYKKCCLTAEQSARASDGAKPPDTGAGLRRSVTDALAVFARHPELEAGLRAAVRLFDDGRLAARSERERANLTSSDDWQLKLMFWCLFDAPMNASGETVARAFLRLEGERLTNAQRDLLRRLEPTQLRPYEVAEVLPERGLRLRDLWTEREVFVTEVSATRQLKQWDLLAARIMDEPDGTFGLEGGAYLYPARLTASLLKALRAERRRIRRHAPQMDDDLFLKRCGPLYNQFWLDHVVFPPMPRFVTAEGDAMAFGKVVFDVADRAELVAALDAHPDLQSHEEGTYAWLEDARDGLTRSLGHIALEDDRLVLEVTSRQRAVRGRRLLEKAAGDALRHRATRYESVAKALHRQRSKPRREEPPPIPPEVAAKLIGEYKERHYETWPDEPLPALGGHTPRQAAGLKTLKPKLIDLLKDMENMEARAARPENPAYDFGRIWRELGLERPT